MNIKTINPTQPVQEHLSLKCIDAVGVPEPFESESNPIKASFDPKEAVSIAKGRSGKALYDVEMTQEKHDKKPNLKNIATETTETTESLYSRGFTATDDLLIATEKPTEELLNREKDDYPVNFLPVSLGLMCIEIAEVAKVGRGMAANCALSYLSLACQRLYDVKHPASGGKFPASIFFITIAKSGERKTAIDKVLKESFDTYANDRKESYRDELAEYQAKKDVYDCEVASLLKDKKKASGQKANELKNLYLNAPVKPMPSEMIEGLEGTPEGVFIKLSEKPSLGLFGSEGLSFFSGHGMKKDGGAQGRMITMLSQIWDGSAINRLRATESARLENVRVTLHIMIQPEVMDSIADLDFFQSQGFFPRVCELSPFSRLGDQDFSEEEKKAIIAGIYESCPQKSTVKHFNKTILKILKRPVNRHKNPEDGLELTEIKLTDEKAIRVWVDYYSKVNSELGDGRNGGKVGIYSNISGTAAKSAEIALRFAALFAVYEYAENLTLLPEFEKNSTTVELNISEDNMTGGVGLAEYYLNKRAARSHKEAQDPNRKNAIKVIEWMLKKRRLSIHSNDFSLLPSPLQNSAELTRKAIFLAIDEGAMEPNGDLNSRGEHRSWLLTQRAKAWLSQSNGDKS